ncbi:hypothetical protein ACFQI7_17375 [Paenibacillus allorhizosphaerae]|uniref:PilZ domain-containing protein n=1 Tax=Paenibacillus allorhizosphaerae TaxID=2849866 RepID=A0ABM8VEJ1_9BACL|nr:hypothetical protein [Paenibacillus allorhizosphaerae]CAG7631544.1 hypothetical protein PAECIP111802_01754 [Paenibacillus allorhizosphaerae]
MNHIQMLYNGKVYQGAVAYEGAELMELSMEKPVPYKGGDAVLCFDFKRRRRMRILRGSGNKLIVAPEESEIFRINAQPEQTNEDLLLDDDMMFESFKLNVFGTISEDFRTLAVRFVDICRLGFGFEIDDFSVKLNHVYDTMIFCDEETIHPKLIVRYVHIMEKTIRYGAEIHKISAKDLNKLRYFIAAKQFAGA